MKHVTILFCCAVLFSACVRNNPKPIWLTIDNWTLEANPIAENDAGQLTQNLSEVWVYVDNKIIGVFDLPCKIPVLASGENKKIQLYPAIRNNGISATKKIYPFLEHIEVTMDLVPGQTYHFAPVTRYISSTQFWIEDFSSPSQIKIETDPESNAGMTYENDPAICLSTGNRYGHVHMTTTDSLWIGYTDNMVLPKGKEVYLEIDYRNSVSVLTGVLGISSSGTTDNPDISLNAQDPATMHWKKIYIDLKEILSYSTSAEYFKQYLRVLLDVPNGATDGDVYIDNVKVVYIE